MGSSSKAVPLPPVAVTASPVTEDAVVPLDQISHPSPSGEARGSLPSSSKRVWVQLVPSSSRRVGARSRTLAPEPCSGQVISCFSCKTVANWRDLRSTTTEDLSSEATQEHFPVPQLL